MDAQTFQAETLRIERLLYHVAYSALGNDDECADYVQEAILSAWKHRHALRNTEAFKAWMVRILMRTIADGRRKKRPAPLPEGWDAPARDADTLPLRDALLRLPQDMRYAVVLVYIDGCSLKEASDMLRVPEGTVKSRLFRARRQLREELS